MKEQEDMNIFDKIPEKNNNIFFDLRMVSNAIGGAVANLESDNSGVDRKFYMAMLKGNFMRLKRILNNAEEIGNIRNNGTQMMRSEFFDVSKMIEEIVAYAKKRFPNTISDKLNLTAKLFYYGDYDMIYRVLVNIICNSIKYTEKDTPCSLEINARYAEKKSKIKIKIKDSGLGIPRKNLDKIFSRMDLGALDYCSNVGRGSGLGLAYVKEAVKLHGGTVSVTSGKKGGTEFVIVLPVKKVPSDNICDSYVHFNDYIECEYYDVRLRKGEIKNARSSK